MTTGDKIRDIKRPYRKKSLQTGYAQSGKAVVNHPVPYHSYATDTHQATQVVRPGVDVTPYLPAFTQAFIRGQSRLDDLARESLLHAGDYQSGVEEFLRRRTGGTSRRHADVQPG